MGQVGISMTPVGREAQANREKGRLIEEPHALGMGLRVSTHER
jgi:hypothetical protein